MAKRAKQDSEARGAAEVPAVPKVETADSPAAETSPAATQAAGTDAPREPAAGSGDGASGDPAGPAATIMVATAKRSIKQRRRAGLVFGPEPVTIDLATLSPEQLAAIKADPALKVERSVGEGAEGAAPAD